MKTHYAPKYLLMARCRDEDRVAVFGHAVCGRVAFKRTTHPNVVSCESCRSWMRKFLHLVYRHQPWQRQ